jgi:hypothetical protein
MTSLITTFIQSLYSTIFDRKDFPHNHTMKAIIVTPTLYLTCVIQATNISMKP